MREASWSAAVLCRFRTGGNVLIPSCAQDKIERPQRSESAGAPGALHDLAEVWERHRMREAFWSAVAAAPLWDGSFKGKRIGGSQFLAGELLGAFQGRNMQEQNRGGNARRSFVGRNIYTAERPLPVGQSSSASNNVHKFILRTLEKVQTQSRTSL